MVGMTGLELLLLRKFRAPHALNNSASVTRFLNSPRALSLSLLVNETSPLAVKTTATPVVFILAPLPRSLALPSSQSIIKKPPARGGFFIMVGMTGLEPATSSSRTKRSTRLNYIPEFRKHNTRKIHIIKQKISLSDTLIRKTEISCLLRRQ